MVWSVRLKDVVAAVAVLGVAAAIAAIVAGPGAAGATVGGLLVAGLALVHLTSRARAQADEATRRARQAETRARESRLLAEAASSLLAADPGPTLGPRMERALAEAGVRLQLCHAPTPRPGETALPLKMSGSSGWLYVDRDGPWTKQDAERVLGGLSELIALAQARARTSETAAEATAAGRADTARTAVMHAIAHDLRTPVTAITTAASALGEQHLGDGGRLELASVVATESGRIEAMVDDLLDLSRIEAGAVNPQPDWCDLNETVNRAADRVRTQHGDFPLRVDLPADLPRISADGAQLERAFTNLIDNAAKFSPSDKPVEVRGACANGRVTIRVLDHGCGIPPAQHSQVFKPFVRGRDTESGSGLGLAISRGFVEANGGRITLQSRGRDGAAFAVSFPAAAQPSPVG